jgi:hypothetical protein
VCARTREGAASIIKLLLGHHLRNLLDQQLARHASTPTRHASTPNTQPPVVSSPLQLSRITSKTEKGREGGRERERGGGGGRGEGEKERVRAGVNGGRGKGGGREVKT